MWARRPTGQTAKHSRVSGYLPHRIFFARHRSHITDSLITSACCSGVSSSFEILSLAFSRLSTGSYLLSVSHNCTSQMASPSAQAAQVELGCICRLECKRRFHAPEVKIAPAKATFERAQHKKSIKTTAQSGTSQEQCSPIKPSVLEKRMLLDFVYAVHRATIALHRVLLQQVPQEVHCCGRQPPGVSASEDEAT